MKTYLIRADVSGTYTVEIRGVPESDARAFADREMEEADFGDLTCVDYGEPAYEKLGKSDYLFKYPVTGIAAFVQSAESKDEVGESADEYLYEHQFGNERNAQCFIKSIRERKEGR